MAKGKKPSRAVDCISPSLRREKLARTHAKGTRRSLRTGAAPLANTRGRTSRILELEGNQKPANPQMETPAFFIKKPSLSARLITNYYLLITITLSPKSCKPPVLLAPESEFCLQFFFPRMTDQVEIRWKFSRQRICFSHANDFILRLRAVAFYFYF